MSTSTTKTEEREQWRARLMRALSELRTDIPGHAQQATGERSETNDATRG